MPDAPDAPDTPDLLPAWLAQERDIRERVAAGPGAGPINPAHAQGLSGLEMMLGIAEGRLHVPPIGMTLDFLMVEAADGFAVFQGEPGPRLLNPMGTVHGGWYATLLDSAMGCAVMTRLPAGTGYTTAELSVNIVRAIRPDVQRVRAEGRVVHVGRQLATAEGRLFGPDGTLYAHGTTTCLVFEARPPKSVKT